MPIPRSYDRSYYYQIDLSAIPPRDDFINRNKKNSVIAIGFPIHFTPLCLYNYFRAWEPVRVLLFASSSTANSGYALITFPDRHHVHSVLDNQPSDGSIRIIPYNPSQSIYDHALSENMQTIKCAKMDNIEYAHPSIPETMNGGTSSSKIYNANRSESDDSTPAIIGIEEDDKTPSSLLEDERSGYIRLNESAFSDIESEDEADKDRMNTQYGPEPNSLDFECKERITFNDKILIQRVPENSSINDDSTGIIFDDIVDLNDSVIVNYFHHTDNQFDDIYYAKTSCSVSGEILSNDSIICDYIESNGSIFV